MDTPTEVWTKQQSLKDWVWSLMEHKIKIANGLHKKIVVIQAPVAGGPSVPAIFVWPGQVVEIKSYTSYTLNIMDENYVKSVYATVVTSETDDSIIINEPQETDLKSLREAEDKALLIWSGWIWTHSDRHLRNLKQPLLIHNYTVIPYHQTVIPPDLYYELRKYYDDNKGDRYVEKTLDEVDSIIRHESLKTMPTMVPLPPRLFHKCEKIITPMLEKFCNCKLELSDMYGVREYYEGNVLHNHVDRVSTHVMGIILQIDQDLGGKEDWLLEVIDYNGKRKHVKLEPGEMLMYESAKLIHGRPRALRGNLFANAFMHFKPVSGWDFDCDERVFVSPSRQIHEPLTPLETDLTYRRKIFPVRSEL